MALSGLSPEELARREREQALIAKREAATRFAQSPAGRARFARNAGRKVFQIDLEVSRTQGQVVPLVAAFASSTAVLDAAGHIEAIEDEGWRLEHVGYVYRMTGSTSRDKFMASGQEEAMHGEVVGVYLFRATEGPPPHPAPDGADDDGGRTLLDARG